MKLVKTYEAWKLGLFKTIPEKLSKAFRELNIPGISLISDINSRRKDYSCKFKFNLSNNLLNCTLTGYESSELSVFFSDGDTHGNSNCCIMITIELSETSDVSRLCKLRSENGGSRNNYSITTNCSVSSGCLTIHSEIDIDTFKKGDTKEIITHSITSMIQQDWDSIEDDIQGLILHQEYIKLSKQEEKKKQDLISKKESDFKGLMDELSDHFVELEDMAKLEKDYNLGQITFSYRIPEIKADGGDVILNDTTIKVIGVVRQFKSRWEDKMGVETLLRFREGFVQIVFRLVGVIKHYDEDGFDEEEDDMDGYEDYGGYRRGRNRR